MFHELIDERHGVIKAGVAKKGPAFKLHDVQHMPTKQHDKRAPHLFIEQVGRSFDSFTD